MCYICDFIMAKRPNLKQVDDLKKEYPNVTIMPKHLETIAQTALFYAPWLIEEVNNEMKEKEIK